MGGMTGPAFLADIVGALMLAAAAYAVVRIVAAWRSGKATDYSVEICHAVTGVCLAGILIPGMMIVTPGPSTWAWLVIFALISLRFAISALRDLASPPQRAGSVSPLHHLPRVVLSGAMVYLLAAIRAMSGSAASSSMSGRSGMSMSRAPMMPWPTLDLLLTFFLVGYTVLLTDRLSSIGQRRGIGEPRARDQRGEVAVYAPRGAAVLAVVMAAGMAYLLIMMFA